MRKKLIRNLTLIVAALAVVVTGTLAWFMDIDTPPRNRFDGGIINIRANETLIPEPFEIEDWPPGEPVEQEYTIINNGTVPIFLRGSFIGSWTPLTGVTGTHKNTATVTAEYEGQIVTDEDSAHYYVNVNNP